MIVSWLKTTLALRFVMLYLGNDMFVRKW